jgi:hypothetical protein
MTTFAGTFEPGTVWGIDICRCILESSSITLTVTEPVLASPIASMSMLPAVPGESVISLGTVRKFLNVSVKSALPVPVPPPVTVKVAPNVPVPVVQVSPLVEVPSVLHFNVYVPAAAGALQ